MAKSNIGKFMREFVSEENRNYRLRLGSTLASSLAGIVTGIILASVVWYSVLKSVLGI